MFVGYTFPSALKEDNVQDIIEAIILNRVDRKYWYVKYQVIFENNTVKTIQQTTKVLKTEKSLSFMQAKYLPSWIVKQKEKLNCQVIQQKTFEYYASIFLDDYRKFHDFKNIKYRLDRILKYFQKKRIDEITRLDLRRWVSSIKNANTGKELSNSSKKKYMRVFRGIFEIAFEDEAIKYNWTKDIKVSARNDRNLHAIKPFSKHEVKILLENSKVLSKYGDYLHNYLGIAFNQGMSPSEIIGLKLKDIDLEAKTISIQRNITKNKIKETKNVYRTRIIPVFNSSMPYLLDLIQNAKRKKSIWLFSNEDGSNLKDIEIIRGSDLIVKNNKTLKKRNRWYLLLHDCGIEYRAIKNCRHTFAVSAIECKSLTLQEIANILGHNSLQMLINHYAKWIGDKALSVDRNINLFE